MRRSTCVVIALWVASLMIWGCGSEETPEAEERCGEDGYKAFLVGSIEGGGVETDLQISNSGDTPGLANVNEMRLVVGMARPPGSAVELPVILRIYDTDGGRNLLLRLSEILDEEEAVHLTVTDASEVGAGSQGRTDLDGFDCAFGEGKICVQLGFDSVGDQLLGDNDEHAYNATGGSVSFVGLDNVTRRVHVQLEVELGRNVLEFGDESTGSVGGCVSPGYRLDTDFWPLL
jgi:hypothetical protein